MSESQESSSPSAKPNPVKLSPVEAIKESSNYLAGPIGAELADDTTHFGKDSIQLLKHHGMYQQDDRDQRMANREKGIKDKSYSMMLRTRLPGGRLTADQMRAEMEIGDQFGNHDIRLTTRQAIQHHGILKSNLREVIQRINDAKMSTLAACGDVNRNIMCCPAPIRDETRAALEDITDRLTDHLSPRTKSYYELWLRPDGSEEKELVGGAPESDVVEPIYGKTYLPRKFKTGIGFCHDNCIDIYTQDLGFLAVVRDERLIGFNVLVGGGMGMTPAKKTTFPAVAKRMAFIERDQVLDVAEAVVKVQRDHGNRADRKHARMKYLIHNWGLERFKSTVEDYFGQSLPDPEPEDVHGFDDHLGWHEQGDGRLFYGLNIENGRIIDRGDMRLRSAIYEICRTFGTDMRVTSHQSLLITDLDPQSKPELERLLTSHGVKLSREYSTVRRWSMACVAWPTCGLAITESERALPGILDELEPAIARLGLSSDAFTIRMTGCPNGCARPYNADIGLVGKAKDRYTIYLGGRLLGNRLGFIYKDLVGREDLVEELTRVLAFYKSNRHAQESLGDFCNRIGKDNLIAASEETVSAS